MIDSDWLPSEKLKLAGLNCSFVSRDSTASVMEMYRMPHNSRTHMFVLTSTFDPYGFSCT
jgi:hypothetical protein